MVQLLRHQRAKLDTICDQKKQPVQKDYAVGLARPPVLNVLDVEDDGEGGEIEYSCPEAEITSPYASEVFNLDCSLQGSSSQKGAKDNLQSF